ncbi:MAG: tol-pal system-associated acyl-CoA thioesterase [Brachymonas sp.]|nr:tol-pal system-associated acyl-CoA thioesterase [Brachymonas sp.]
MDTATPPSFSLPVRVYWEDTDAGGVVYNANYLKFFERARSEWLRSLDVHQQALRDETGGVFVVSEIAIKYHRPARLDDLLTITVCLQQMGKASMVFTQQARRGGVEGELMAEATVRVGWVDAEKMRPVKMPADVLQRLAAG